MTMRRVVSIVTGTLSAGALLCLVGCLTTEQMAPPVGVIASGGVGAAGVDTARLERGRDVYLRRCSACHAMAPIDGQTLEDWGDILPEMMGKAKLDSDQQQVLRRYIEAAHGYLSLVKGPES